MRIFKCLYFLKEINNFLFVNLLEELDRYIGQPIYIGRYQGQADMID